MSGGGQLWRGVTTVTLLALSGMAVPALPSEPAELRMFALVGVGLVLLGLVILSRLVSVRDER